jgi:putative endonuclease
MVDWMNKGSSGLPHDHRQRLGRWGENLAADFLKAKGFQILARNWRSRYGEIDLITQTGEIIAFVEVKTRKSRKFGLPEEGLTPKKAKRLQGLAQQYLAQNDLHEVDWRIDLVAVELDQNGRLVRCEHIPYAVLGW